MAFEIEHKYLVESDIYKEMSDSCIHIVQGYLSRKTERTVRVRIIGDRGFITVKGRNDGARRLEFEYEIPLRDAKQIMTLCESKPLEKNRWKVFYKDHLWEVDEYLNRDFPTVAEIELSSIDETYEKPPFIGKNVTGDPAYYNSNIV